MEFFGFYLHDTHGCLLLIVIFIKDISDAVCSECHVRLKSEQVLVVSVYHSGNEAEKDETVFRTQVHTSIKQEMDRSTDLAMPDYILSWYVLTLVHLDDTLITESFLEELKV